MQSRNGAIIVCASSHLRRNKRGCCQGLATDGSSARHPGHSGDVSLLLEVPACSSHPVTPSLPEGSGWSSVGLSQHSLEPSPGRIRAPPVPRLAQGRAWKQQAPSQLLFSSASLGTFPVVTARTLEGLPEPKHSRRRSPPPPDIDSRGGSRS